VARWGMASVVTVVVALTMLGCGALDELDPDCRLPPDLVGLDPSALVGTYHGKPGSSLTLNADMTAVVNLPRSGIDPQQDTRTDLVGTGTWALSQRDTSRLEFTIGNTITQVGRLSGTAARPVISYVDGNGGCDHNDMTRDGPSPS
jgi:hypothetical protein